MAIEKNTDTMPKENILLDEEVEVAVQPEEFQEGGAVDIEMNGMGRADRNTFAHGMVNRILGRMEHLYKKRQEMKTSESLALVPVKKEAVEKFFKSIYPVTRKTRASSGSGSRSSWEKGQIAGDRVSLSNGVNGAANKQIAA